MVILITILTITIWIRVLYHFDNAHRLKSRRTGVRGFFLYGLLSIPLVMVLYRIGEAALLPFIWRSPILEEIFLVGPVEESAKFMIFYLVATRKATIQEPKDGILHAASVGLAFSVIENILYSYYGFETMIYRSILCTAGHMSYAAIWGYAAGVYLYTYPGDRETYPFSIVLTALVSAAALHGLYNSFLELGLPAPALLLNAGTVSLSLLGLSYLKKLSPFTEIPYDRCWQAITEIDDALGNNPDNFALHKRIALHYIRAGVTEEALMHLKKASALSPRELSSRFYLALLGYLVETESPGGARRVPTYAASFLIGQGKSAALLSTAVLSAPPLSAAATLSASTPSRETLYRLMRKMPLKSFIRIKNQVKEVFTNHPREEEINNLCNELLVCKRGFKHSATLHGTAGKNPSPSAARITGR